MPKIIHSTAPVWYWDVQKTYHQGGAQGIAFWSDDDFIVEHEGNEHTIRGRARAWFYPGEVKNDDTTPMTFDQVIEWLKPYKLRPYGVLPGLHEAVCNGTAVPKYKVH